MVHGEQVMAKKNEQIEKEIFYKNRSAWDKYPVKQRKDIFKFAEEYKIFIDQAKTERESVKVIIACLKNAGFKDLNSLKKILPGDKIFKVIKGRSLIAAVAGKDTDVLRIIASHIDSPRLDLKPSPIYEDSSLCMLKSHYYGGIKKYQWVNVPLALHAVVHTKKGKKEFTIGESPDDPKFIVPDLLPHLARDQMEKKMREAIRGEDLHIIVGNIPIDDEKVKEKVKFTVLKQLNQDYGIVEKDFLSADITFVPAQKAMDIGIDRSMIAAYAQDDHVCAYTSLRAFLDIAGPAKVSTKAAFSIPKHTALCMFTDKEEIGSYGDTGAQSRMLEHFVSDYLTLLGSKTRITQVFERSYALSGDVTDAVNPIFKDVHDSSNASYLGHGVSVEKYGGSGGKYSTSEASSEYMSWLVGLLDKKGIKWQTGELGKIDGGGGGTIGMFIAKYGIDVIDIGPCVLSMHSPIEVTSKVDIYETYRAYKVFFEN